MRSRVALIALVAACSRKTDPPVSKADEAAAIAVVDRYLKAVAAHDWAAACATRRERERDETARIAGSCERAFAAMFEDQPVEVFATARPAGVRHRGGTIAVDMVQPNQTEPLGTFYAVRDAGAWLLIDLPDEQGF